MSNIYLKVTIETISQNFDFLDLKKCVTQSVFLGVPANIDITVF